MTLTRRNFIKSTFTATVGTSLSIPIPDFLTKTCAAETISHSHGENVLIVVQLTGGNDGLNTVVPYEDDVYGRGRPTIRLSAGKLHKIDSNLAFHPRMDAFQRLFQEGLLSIVHNVGFPGLSRNHEAAMKIWHSCNAENNLLQTGWLGRIADAELESHKINSKVAFVSTIRRPLILNAAQALIPRIDNLENLKIHRWPITASKFELNGNSINPMLDFLRQQQENSFTIGRKIESITKHTSHNSNYPSYRLAHNLRIISQLIRARAGIRIYFTELGGDGFGGFDNHANQIGNHCALLHQLSESVSAFITDLKKNHILDNVLLMTFSEFGRTVGENGRRGTGHGLAAPLFLAGGKLKGGHIGPFPDLKNLDNDAIKYNVDFRQIYATVLEKWLGIKSQNILDGKFSHIDILAL